MHADSRWKALPIPRFLPHDGSPPTFLTLALLVPFLTAACTDAPTDTMGVGPSAAVTDDTGAIAGVVVSDALVPLVNVAVAFDGNPGAAFTDDGGAFQLSNVVPGSHDLSFFRDDHIEATQKVTVEAAQVTELQVVLVPRPSQQSYVRVEQDTGFIGCTLTMRDPVLSPEGRAKAAMCTIVAVVSGSSAVDQSQIDYAPEAFNGIGDMVGEVTWVSTQALGTGLFANFWLYHPDVHLTINDAWDLNWSAGPSPLRVPVPIERIEDVLATENADGPECGEKCNVFVLVYSYPQTATSSPVDVGLAVDQRFDMYRSTSFHARLPPEYTALPDA